MSERLYSVETRQALFRALLVARCAGEPSVTGNRLIAALLRTGAVAEFCERTQIAADGVAAAFDDPGTLSFDECSRQIEEELAARGHPLGSKEHIATVERLPIDPPAQEVITALMQGAGDSPISSLELLRELLLADPGLADRAARHGLTAR